MRGKLNVGRYANGGGGGMRGLQDGSDNVNNVVSGPSKADVARHKEYVKRARIYYAYQQIEDLFQPFTSSHPDANFQVT